MATVHSVRRLVRLSSSFVYMYVCVCARARAPPCLSILQCVYIYIYRERERDVNVCSASALSNLPVLLSVHVAFSQPVHMGVTKYDRTFNRRAFLWHDIAILVQVHTSADFCACDV